MELKAQFQVLVMSSGDTSQNAMSCFFSLTVQEQPLPYFKASRNICEHLMDHTSPSPAQPCNC